jgi:hypothetical protein
MNGGEDSPRTFTVSEANALLPQIIPLVEQLQGIQRSIAKTNRQLDEAIEKLSQGNGYPLKSLKEQIKELTTHQLQLVEAFQSVIAQVEEFGCQMKDLSVGLVDFYGLHNGEVVCLCWKLGEDRIRFWHTLEAGYAGRQPLESSS